MTRPYKLLFNTLMLICTFIKVHTVEIVVNSRLDNPASNVAITGPLTVDGVITLRSAIEYANFLGGSNTINFNITGSGPYVINVGTGIGVTGDPLPELTTTVTINGYSQPGAAVATISPCDDTLTVATLLIVLNGEAVTNGTLQNGLTLNASLSEVAGLVIQGFPGHGIDIRNGDSQKIVGNYIGLDQPGTSTIPNGKNGINIAANVSKVIIGSLSVADRNVISGHTVLSSSTNGIGIYTEGSNAQIIGNFIGTDALGTGSVPNRTGVYIFNAEPETPLNNTLKCNTIQNNDGIGQIEGFGIIVSGATGNPILSNSIYNNDKDGIVLINDGNNNLPAPILNYAATSGFSIKVNGTYSSPTNPNASFRIEFFLNPADRASITEGRTYLGRAFITTDGSGNAVFNNIRLPGCGNPGQLISATATLLNNDAPVETSAFSANKALVQGPAESALSFAIYCKYCNRNDLPCSTCN